MGGPFGNRPGQDWPPLVGRPGKFWIGARKPFGGGVGEKGRRPEKPLGQRMGSGFGKGGRRKKPGGLLQPIYLKSPGAIPKGEGLGPLGFFPTGQTFPDPRGADSISFSRNFWWRAPGACGSLTNGRAFPAGNLWDPGGPKGTVTRGWSRRSKPSLGGGGWALWPRGKGPRGQISGTLGALGGGPDLGGRGLRLGGKTKYLGGPKSLGGAPKNAGGGAETKKGGNPRFRGEEAAEKGPRGGTKPGERRLFFWAPGEKILGKRPGKKKRGGGAEKKEGPPRGEQKGRRERGGVRQPIIMGARERRKYKGRVYKNTREERE